MPTILVMDDDKPTRELLERALSGAGYTVLTAVDGQTGLDRFRQQSVDLVVMDIYMPGMNGPTAMLKILREKPEVKVIVLSGAHIGTELVNFLPTMEQLGASCTFEKPLEMNILLKTVAKLLTTPEGG